MKSRRLRLKHCPDSPCDFANGANQWPNGGELMHAMLHADSKDEHYEKTCNRLVHHT
jgi:hypothetical protein